MKNNTLWIAIGVIVVLALGWWWFSSMQQPAPQAQAPQENGAVAGSEFVDNSKDSAPSASAGVSVGVGQPVSAFTVKYTDQGFSPSTMTIKKGTTVTFVNQSSHGMWVASADHPTHTVYSGTSKDQHCPSGSATAFDECAVGNTYTFTFDKVGSWSYHNHVSSGDKGTIIVTN